VTEIRVLSWNLFHGRDAPPDRALMTARSRLRRRSEHNETHVQVNRNLYEEFATVLADVPWDVALLQECPPRWTAPLASDCGAEVHRTLTSRNWLLPLTSAVARRNPDLIASWEGGANAILVRPSAGGIQEATSQTLRRLPERRKMAFARLGARLCVTSLHASEHESLAEREILNAAQTALEWAGGVPLVLGGDFNLRGRHRVFDALAENYGLTGVTAEGAIDHLLVWGADAGPPRVWEPEAREVLENGLAVRLSDHTPIERVLRVPGPA
jgi:endonuclease/exonuclease/phosphatase family metal-dependent hydrolase